MDKLKNHIISLLHEYECIIIPGFGALLAAPISAKLDEEKELIFPPSKKIAFNQQLDKNDALIIHTWTKTYKLTYEDAAKEIHEEVEKWHDHLKSGKELIIEKVGLFKTDDENKISFKASGNYNFLLDTYGMTEVTAKPVIQTATEEKIQKLYAENSNNSSENELKKEKKEINLRISRYAATVSVLIALSIAMYFLPDETIQLNVGTLSPFKHSLPAPASEQYNKSYIESGTSNNTITNTDAKVITGSTLNKSNLKQNYFIIGGSFSQKDNAIRFSNQLNHKGFNSKILNTDFNMYRVSYMEFDNETEAEQYLIRIKKEENPSAWLLEEEI